MLIALLFFPVTLILVVGIPQLLEIYARRKLRASDPTLHRPDDWKLVSNDLDDFYLPIWGRMFVMLIGFAIIFLIKW